MSRISIVIYFCFSVILPLPAFAGNLDSPGTTTAGSGMPTIQSIYDQLCTGTTATIATSFQEPTVGPINGTGKTLSDIQGKLPAADSANAASAADVPAGKTFWGLGTAGAWGPQTGSLPLQDNVSGTDGSLIIPIPDGYYSGGKTATATDPTLTSANIKSGVTIFGVKGSLVNPCEDSFSSQSACRYFCNNSSNITGQGAGAVSACNQGCGFDPCP